MIEVVEFISDDTRGFAFFASKFYTLWPWFVVGENIILGSGNIMNYYCKYVFAYENIIIII